MIPDNIKEKIDRDEWTFTDKILKGGFGYGKFCIPDELPQVVMAVIFPPLSILWNWHLGYYSIWETIKKFFICLLLTMCFYLPGLIYAINELSCKARVKISEQKYLDKTLQESQSGVDITDY
tara:strand:+ start:432 stop:797 length:366 start_codon:yes stop_codon:yes gene_type:complete